MSVPVIPSPLPPYSRISTTSPQTLTDDGEIDLSRLTTYLVAATNKTAVLPNGTVRQQQKRIFIPSDDLVTTGQWTVTGTFGGFDSLEFTKIGSSAIVEWDGAGWQLVGGNAESIA